MANSYTSIHFHLVFAVKSRFALLHDTWREELFAYVGGVLKNQGYIPVKIGGWRDHLHILFGIEHSIDIPQLVKDLKLATNAWIQPHIPCRFSWQRGYGCFSVSYTHMPDLINYIHNQPSHHTRVSMVDELRQLCNKNGIDFDDKGRYFFIEPE